MNFFLYTCEQADYQPHTDRRYCSDRTEVQVGQRVPVICQHRPGGGGKDVLRDYARVKS